MALTILADALKKCNVNNDKCKHITLNGERIWSSEFFVYNKGIVGEDEGAVTLTLHHQGWNSNEVKQSKDSKIEEDHIHLIGAGSGGGRSGGDNVDSASWVVFDNVDVSDAETLYMTFDLSAVSSAAPAILAVSDTEPSSGAGMPQRFITYHTLVANQMTTGKTYGKVTNQTISCNVKNLTGKKKIIAMTWANSYDSGYYSDLYIYSIKLE